MTGNIERGVLAQTILDWYKRHPKKKLHITKYVIGKIEVEGRPMTKGEMGCGIRYAHQCGCLKRISNNRWEIIRYTLSS